MEHNGAVAGRVVLLTGAGGPAAALTRRLVALGCRVAVASGACGAVTGPGTPVLDLPCAVDDPAAVGRAVDSVVRHFGRLDHLVNLVALGSSAVPLMQLDPSALHDVLRRDLVTPLAWIQRAHQRWMAEHGGSVVNVVADAVRDAPQDSALAALVALTEWLAAELAPRVRVHTLVPGPTVDTAPYQAALVDTLPGLLPVHDPLGGPVLVLTDRSVRQPRAA